MFRFLGFRDSEEARLKADPRLTLGDVTTLAIQAALHGLETRRAAHESNIANIETPGYRARVVEFEGALKRAMETGRAEFEPSVSTSNAAARSNGNNVDVGGELVGLTETALTQELLIRALNDKYGLVRSALGQG